METINKISEALDKIKEGMRILDCGPPSYYFEKLKNQNKMLFERFCPFKMGERVQLKKTPNIPEDSGWYGSRHFLKKGSIATIRNIDTSELFFVFGLVFDKESYFDSEGKEHLAVNKHRYTFPENDIEKVTQDIQKEGE